MTTRSARKGKHFQDGVIIPYLRDWFGPHVCHPTDGAALDLGDVAGIPDWAIQIKNYVDLMRAVREGLAGLEVQQANARARHGGLIVKRAGKADPAEQLFVCKLGAAIPLIRETAAWELSVEDGAA